MIFSRKRRLAPAEAVAAFWQWWPQVRPRVEAAVQTGDWGTIADEVSERVNALDPELEWEFSSGSSSAHALVVTPCGDAKLRATAARWLAGAPAPDATWEFHASRQPDPAALEAEMQIGGAELPLADLRYVFEVDEDRPVVSVHVHHPMFGALPEQVRTQVAFLSLDWLLGEDGVETWIQGVEAAVAPPPADAHTGAALKATVDGIAAAHREPVWALLSAEDRGMPVIATVQMPLRPVRFPRFDTHVAVTLPFKRMNEGGLPVEGSLDALRALEDDITAALDGDGDLLAHETSRGVRKLHYYVDGGTGAAQVVERRAAAWSEGKVRCARSYDPEFDGLDHLGV
ncbi:hypothetical protein Val02_59030 [Virgisporangium aliadipatigenens]|uniref:DUF695 domain-containing protein n=1 Tax=Virgisporangium aliadipatigenens TaxID=741659 RepID=A0A8J4DUB7_9ACTN|nr:DUF695 domain-containing protein [Virgisporangium aliadipatigenens]GIJ49017.1 hypothetical protein Val02_59030 [Virgisporangium aliadipatigenens]